MVIGGSDAPALDDQALRTIAFYLPQFHPIRENDEWWGPGFTEWRRVVAARPRFRGHQQPDLPGELGFYDLRAPEARAAQASLASEHGVDAFCYYHYWFSGRRLLDRPFAEVLSSGEPDFPFVLCWANEPWTRAWDGTSGTVLIDQDDQPNDSERFIRELLPAFADARYLTVGSRPLLLVYRALRLRDPRRTTDVWRSEVTAAGLPEPYLCRVESFVDERGDPSTLGFDGAVEFQPDWRALQREVGPGGFLRAGVRRARSVRTLRNGDRVIPYEELLRSARAKPEPGYPRWPCVTPGWDNSPRRAQRATILAGSTPELYEAWTRDAAAAALSDPSAPLLFVNAWNEWGEGCHLEPSARFGRAYLEAHRRAVRSAVALSDVVDSRPT